MKPNQSIVLRDWANEKRGRVAALARHLSRSTSFVHKIVNGDKPVPVELGASIEGFTGISRRQLFPDRWVSIWPELADTPTTDVVRDAA